MPPPVPSKEFWEEGEAAAKCAITCKTCVAPIERVRLLLQTQHAPQRMGKDQHYKGIGDCFEKVTRQQGFLSLWRGNFTTIIRCFPNQSLQFAFKKKYQMILLEDVDIQFGKFFLANLASGGAAGVTSICFLYPLDFARTRLAADIGRGAGDRAFTGLGNCLWKVIKSDGIQGIYRGFLVSVPGAFIYRASYFGLYDTVRGTQLLDKYQKNHFICFTVAQITTAFSVLIAYPFDTVRRRMMMQSGKKGGDVVYKSALDCWRKIEWQEGGRGFFKGAFTNVLRSYGGAVILVLLEEFSVFR